MRAPEPMRTSDSRNAPNRPLLARGYMALDWQSKALVVFVAFGSMTAP